MNGTPSTARSTSWKRIRGAVSPVGPPMRRSLGMSRRLLLLAIACFLIAAVPAAPAAAKHKDLSKAKIVKVVGDGHVLWYGKEAPEGGPMVGTTMKRHHFYEF